MKRVLFLTRYYAPHVGGVETHVYQIAEQLQSRGFEVTILTSRDDPQLPEREYQKNVQVIRMPFDSEVSKQKTWSWILGQKRLFSEEDIVHVHDVFWWVIPILPFIHHKLYITFHGWEGKFPLKKAAIWQRQFAAKVAKGNIQVGGFIQKWYGTKPTVVTYGAVSRQLATRQRDTKGMLEKMFTALRNGSVVSGTARRYTGVFVGRLSSDNDIEKVIDFFARWKEVDHTATFAFVGDGEYRRACEKIGKVVGFVDQPEQYILEAKIVCASSYLSIMMAHLCKKLVVSFYTNPLKKDYLMLYPQSKNMIVEDSVLAALEKVQRVVGDNREYAQKVQTAYSWVITQTWQKLADTYEQVWDIHA